MAATADLYYFNIKGLAEGIRLLLVYGGEKFNDHRITKEEWPELKPKTKFGQLPELVIDGKTMAQSVAISRYLGHKYGVAGKDAAENFDIDEVMEFLQDIRKMLKALDGESDPEKKAKLYEEHQKNVFPAKLEKLHDFLKANNGYMALGKLTWIDFYFVGQYDRFKALLQIPDLDTRYQGFKNLVDKVHSLPKVKEYVATRPQTEY